MCVYVHLSLWARAHVMSRASGTCVSSSLLCCTAAVAFRALDNRCAEREFGTERTVEKKCRSVHAHTVSQKSAKSFPVVNFFKFQNRT